ncbi:MAG: glycosyltransferase [Crocinitomicaceae bacterium]|nr:glycosyltransferase [Crocinitomicaceae bacterium]
MLVLTQNIDDGIILFLFTLFIVTITVQLYYILFIFQKLAFLNPQRKSASNEIPISVIIAARNESHKLQENLRFILEQDYSNFELIVVNNNSSDDSYQVLSALKKGHNHLKIIEFNNPDHIRQGKKLPLTLGIKAAKNEHLLLTDADCKPKSNQWIKKMAKGFKEKEIILGYGPYIKTSGLLNSIIRFDTAWIGMNYFSFALNGVPYMGVGRNLAYTKSAYQAVDGYKSHHMLASGDDDLFIQEASKKSSLGIEIDADTHCFSPSKNTWSEWIHQKSRHFTTTPKYSFIKKLLLATYPITLVATWFSFVSLMILSNSVFICIIMILFYLAKWWIQGKCLIKLNERKFALFFPFWDLFYSFLSPVLYIVGKTKRNKNW